MERFKTKVKSKKLNINFSTRYDDREIIVMAQSEQLEFLAIKMFNDTEEVVQGGDILKLERLVEQYLYDGNAALKDENMAYYIRYARAYERGTELLHAMYECLGEIDFRLDRG